MSKIKKIRRLYYLKESTVKTIEEMAEKESRKLSAIIDLAIEKAYEKAQE